MIAPSRKSAILALTGFVVFAGIELGGGGEVQTGRTAGSPQTECNSRDPLSPCVAETSYGYPMGDGLVITLIEDLF